MRAVNGGGSTGGSKTASRRARDGARAASPALPLRVCRWRAPLLRATVERRQPGELFERLVIGQASAPNFPADALRWRGLRYRVALIWSSGRRSLVT